MSLNEILVKFIFNKIWIVDIKCKRMSSQYALYIYNLLTENKVNLKQTLPNKNKEKHKVHKYSMYRYITKSKM